MYFKLSDRYPFVEMLRTLYAYSKWVKNCKKSLEDENNGYFEKMFSELHRSCLVNKVQSSCKLQSRPLLIITTYNDHDIIEAIVRRNSSMGFDQVLIDNWSDDGTWDILLKLKEELPSIVELMRYPFEGPSPDYQWKAMLELKSEIALRYPNRWILHQDSDEITISPFYGVDIQTVLEAIYNAGYNCISLRMLDFSAVDDNFKIGDPVTYFSYYRFSTIPSYSVQNKIWFQTDEKVNLSESGGHDVKFSKKKIYPLRLPRFHYSIRSTAHAKNKLSPKRMARADNERKTLGWHTHLDVRLTERVIFNKEELIKYDFDELYSDKFNWFKYYDEAKDY